MLYSDEARLFTLLTNFFSEIFPEASSARVASSPAHRGSVHWSMVDCSHRIHYRGWCQGGCECGCMCVLCVKVCICWYMNVCQTYTNIHLSLCAHLWHFASIVHSMLIVSWVCGYISLCSAVHWNRESHNRLYHWHWTSTSWRTWQDSSAW